MNISWQQKSWWILFPVLSEMILDVVIIALWVSFFVFFVCCKKHFFKEEERRKRKIMTLKKKKKSGWLVVDSWVHWSIDWWECCDNSWTGHKRVCHKTGLCGTESTLQGKWVSQQGQSQSGKPPPVTWHRQLQSRDWLVVIHGVGAKLTPLTIHHHSFPPLTWPFLLCTVLCVTVCDLSTQHVTPS